MKQPVFGYTIEQPVRIKAANLNGNIEAMLIGVDGLQYKVSYWVESNRKTEWVMPYEIEPIPKDLK